MAGIHDPAAAKGIPMKYFHVSAAMPEKEYGDLFGFGKNSPGQQAQRYNKLLAKGLADLGNETCVLSVPPIPRSVRFFKKTSLPGSTENGLEYRFFEVLNVPVIKNVFAYFQGKKAVKKLVKEYGADNIRVSCDLLSLSASLGVLKAARKAGVKIAGVVTDLPSFLAGAPSSRLYGKMFAKAASLCGGIVAVTKQAAAKLLPETGAGGKPFTVIEGIASPENISADAEAPENIDFSGKTVLYAGGLEHEYGIMTLVFAFKEAAVPDSRLIICGAGTLADEIERIAAEDGSVVYAGVVPNSKVRAAEKKVTLLVNPRPAGEFTAYSFPSKNIEYMSSGTPVLAYMLPGIPEEYREFMIIPAAEDEKSLAEALREALNLPCDILRKKGEAAAEFVMAEKSPAKQAAKLIALFDGM